MINEDTNTASLNTASLECRAEQEEPHLRQYRGEVVKDEAVRKSRLVWAANQALDDGHLRSAIKLYEHAGAYPQAAKAAERAGQYSRAIYNYMRAGQLRDADYIIDLLRGGRL